MKLPASDLYREWVQNPETKAVAQRVKAERDGILLRNLLRMCRSSTDANVRGALQKYDSAQEWLDQLEGKRNGNTASETEDT